LGSVYDLAEGKQKQLSVAECTHTKWLYHRMVNGWRLLIILALVLVVMTAPLVLRNRTLSDPHYSGMPLVPIGGPMSKRTRKLVRSLIIWIVTGVLAALLPLGVLAYNASQRGDLVSLPGVLKTGELILISVVLMIASYGDRLIDIWNDERKLDGLDILVLLVVPFASTLAIYTYAFNARFDHTLAFESCSERG
jgi:hypothetical protein